MSHKEIIENLHAGIFRSSLAGRGKFLYTNASFRHLLGLSAKEVAAFTLVDIFCERRRYQAFHEKITKEGIIKNFEARLKSKKNSVWCLLSARLVKNEQGQTIINTMVLDISERKKYEKELIQSKELFQTVFDNTAAAITVTDKHEKIIAWNSFAEKMLDMTREDLFNRPVKELYPAKEWRRMRALRIRQKGMKVDVETKIYRRDQSILDVSVSITVLKDSDGHVIGSIGMIRDITAQKLAEKKMRESENKIRIILDNSAASIILTDEHERIISWNKFTEDLLGMKNKDLYFKHISSIYPDKEWKKIRSANIRGLGSKHHIESQVVTKDGKLINVDLSVNVLKDADNKVIGSVGIIQDITEQKRAQEMLVQAKLTAEQANSTKSLFLANMSHEVRTPMNTILGMLDLTMDTSLTDEQKENILIAKDAADSLLGLLNDILDLSRVEAGKITLECIDFQLHNVLKSTIKGMGVLATRKSLELVLNIDPSVPEFVMGDPVRLRQIIINLINNAIKFTSKGKITTTVKFQSQNNDQATLHFSVQDEGIGIAKAKQEHLFQVFTQADNSIARKYGGTGLGLAICKRLVEMMNGRIWVESEEGKGSTFHFTAVLKKVAASEFNHVIEQESQAREDLKDLKVLIAEDNKVNQKIAVKMLESQGWKVSAADNGQDVLNILDKEPFDVILMDSQMPVLNGVETTKIIRTHEKDTGHHIPIIAFTGEAMQEDRRKFQEAGMDGYIAKPIDRKKLYTEIKNVVKKES